MPTFVTPLRQSPQRTFALVNTRTGAVVVRHAAGALTSFRRMKGLLGRASMEPDTALVIAPCNAIHTWFMRFPIDVAMVTKAGEVVKMRSRLGPWRTFAALRAHITIELPESVLEASQTMVGDHLVLKAGDGQ